MTELERFKEYAFVTCGLKSNVELKNGGYEKSIQYLGGVLNGRYSFNADEQRLLYQACNVARAKRLMNND